MDSISSLWHLWVVGALLVIIAFGFLFNFVVPAVRLKGHLAVAIDGLKAIKERSGGVVLDLTEITEGPMHTPELAHSWSEYTETLHPQREVDESGQERVVRWRSTALSEMFFSEHALVVTPLKTEFYKHLPGILTGIGIIGTFLGLIMGLSSFDISDPEQAQKNLTILINSVGHAFWVSGSAITMAMLFTWFEKSLITARFRQVEELRQNIDSLFDAGAGEEYLSRLVTASETQATQAHQIKASLVENLREILTHLTERQLEENSKNAALLMEAQRQHSSQMSENVGKAIAEHLGGPINEIASAVKNVSANQGEAVNTMLTDVLADFSGRMRDMFGDQMRGLTEVLRETSEAMKTSAEKFSTLAADMDAAGKGTVDAMGERLTQALDAMEVRQQAMNDQMGGFVEQIRNLVSESQTESSKKLQDTLAQVGNQVAGVVEQLRKQAEEAAQSQGERQKSFEAATGNAVMGMSEHMDRLLAQSVETHRSLQDAVTKLTGTTTEAIGRMNQGADTLLAASTEFAKAGRGVADTMNASTAAVGEIKTATSSLASAAGAVKDVVADSARTRDAIANMVSDLRQVTENAKREAGVTAAAIARIEAAATKLGEAQLKADDYLQGVNRVLSETHKAFADNVAQSLRTHNSLFQEELRKAVDMVSAAVRDLGDTLEDATVRGR